MKTTSALFLIWLLALPTALSAVEVHDLRCESRTDPLGIDAEKPSLSWKLDGGDQKPDVRGIRRLTIQISTPAGNHQMKSQK